MKSERVVVSQLIDLEPFDAEVLATGARALDRTWRFGEAQGGHPELVDALRTFANVLEDAADGDRRRVVVLVLDQVPEVELGDLVAAMQADQADLGDAPLGALLGIVAQPFKGEIARRAAAGPVS